MAESRPGSTEADAAAGPQASLSPRAALRRVRRRFRRRGSSRDLGDTGYLFYALLLVLLIAVFPVVRALVLAAASPESGAWFAATLGASGGWQPVASFAGVVLAALAGLGALRGPVAPSYFWVTLLAGGPIPARTALSRQFVGALAVLLVLFCALGALVGVAANAGAELASGAVSAGGDAVPAGVAAWPDAFSAGLTLGSPMRTVVLAALAGGAFAVLAACAWLWGQVCGARSWLLAAAIAGLVIVTGAFALPYTPWGLAGKAVVGTAVVWDPSALGSLGTLGAVWAIAAVCLGAVPALLGRLRPESLLQQAGAWERVSTSAGLGDFTTALGAIRATPSSFRHVRAVRRLPALAQFGVRDLVGAARTPVRLAVGCLALAGVGAVACVFALAGGAVAGTAGGAAAAAGGGGLDWGVALLGGCLGLAAYLALSTFTDGFRHAATAAGVPALYGISTGRLFLRHAVFPTAAGLLLPATGGLLAWAMHYWGVTGRGMLGGSGLGVTGQGGGAPEVGAVTATLGAVALAVAVGVAARAFNSLKGPIPVLLATTPISSPAGDPGIIFQLLWRADALIYATAAGALLLLLASTSPVAALGAAAAAALLLCGGTRRRIARG